MCIDMYNIHIIHFRVSYEKITTICTQTNTTAMTRKKKKNRLGKRQDRIHEPHRSVGKVPHFEHGSPSDEDRP